ncbi:hypothetical protein [Halobacillus sp. Marseille-P3879]|uniref:hypothetical protein n=1 Tax=Halobacillus sp. Marseille-P3879 TaxID=2045014 RepID=UPI000C7DE93C|nr:hypothetical protein [Halobacillus sp. Marseille-P3879]
MKTGFILGFIAVIGTLFVTVWTAGQAFNKKKTTGYAASLLIPFIIGLMFQSTLVMWLSLVAVFSLTIYHFSYRRVMEG